MFSIAVGFAVVSLYATHALGPNRKTKVKLESFECGIETQGNARVPFSIKYFFGLLLLICLNGFGQTILNLNKNKTIVFGNLYRPNFKIDSLKESIDPFPYLQISESIISSQFKNKYKYFNRQYIGYLSTNNEIILVVQMLNFKHKRKVRELYYEDWERQFINGFGEFYEKNTALFNISITMKTIKRF